MAERVGFEPTSRLKPATRFPVVLLRPDSDIAPPGYALSAKELYHTDGNMSNVCQGFCIMFIPIYGPAKIFSRNEVSHAAILSALRTLFLPLT